MSTLLYCIHYIQGRILKLVMLEALQLRKGVRWVKDLQSSLEMFGWGRGGVKVEAGPEWTLDEESKAPGEGYCMEESKRSRRLEESS